MYTVSEKNPIFHLQQLRISEYQIYGHITFDYAVQSIRTMHYAAAIFPRQNDDDLLYFSSGDSCFLTLDASGLTTITYLFDSKDSHLKLISKFLNIQLVLTRDCINHFVISKLPSLSKPIVIKNPKMLFRTIADPEEWTGYIFDMQVTQLDLQDAYTAKFGFVKLLDIIDIYYCQSNNIFCIRPIGCRDASYVFPSEHGTHRIKWSFFNGDLEISIPCDDVERNWHFIREETMIEEEAVSDNVEETIQLEVGKLYETDAGRVVKIIAEANGLFFGVYPQKNLKTFTVDSVTTIFKFENEEWVDSGFNAIVSERKTRLYLVTYKDIFGYKTETWEDDEETALARVALFGDNVILTELRV